MTCGKIPPPGDRGQRFEVTYYDPRTNQRHVMGWSETPEGARAMVESIELHPVWEYPQIRDRAVPRK